jgi:mannose/fructose-specific phosphotransferase system component IIA
MVATHGRFASGIQDSVRIIAGDEVANSLEIIDAYIDSSDFTVKVKKFIEEMNPEDEYIIFTDLYGGSVNTTILRSLEGGKPENLYIVSGLNLGLLLETALSNPEEKLGEEGLQHIIDSARREITISPRKEDTGFTETSDDELFN